MEQIGKILRIEKLSLQDGRGMRTVIFFKGCPLHCAWCSTPESQHCHSEVYYQAQKCTHCGGCINACPHQALRTHPETGLVIRNKALCVNCFFCVQACPSKAQRVYGKEMTLKEVMKQIHRDEVFFFHSGGGVTLSGGDILCQAAFAQSILKECADAGIDTMAELDLYGDYAPIAMLLPYLNSFYVDIKLMDSTQHRRWTGVGNETILRNVRSAARACNPHSMHIRTPLIWGINDTKENILETAQFCRELPNCAELEFLPYHRLGQATYAYLGREYAFGNLPVMTIEEALEKVAFLSALDFPFPIRVAGTAIS